MTNLAKNIIKKQADLMLEQMEYSAEIIVPTLIQRGYKVVEVSSGGALGEITFEGKQYSYMAKPCSYKANPVSLELALPEFFEEIITTITQCVKNKAEQLIIMYVPVALEHNTPTVRFVSYFDVVVFFIA